MCRLRKLLSTANAELPRVSTILKVLDDAYAGVPQSSLDTASERGEVLHRLCLSYLASLDGLCAEPVPTPPYLLAYQAFVQWVAIHEVTPVAIEQGSINGRLGFRGTPDALVLFGRERILVLLDLKFTAAILRVNKVQIQAYWRLDLYKDASRVLLVHIKPITGELKIHQVKNNPSDWAAFLNALSVWKWRQA